MILEKFSRISKLTGQIAARKLDILLKATPISHKIYDPHCSCINKFTSNAYNQVRYLSAFSDLRCMQVDTKPLPKKSWFYEQQVGGNKFLETSEDYVNCVPRPMVFDESLVVENLDELLEKSWISMSNSELVESFERLSHYAFKHQELIQDPKFSGVLEVLKSRCEDLSDSDIRHLFKCLQLWNIDKEQEVFIDLWQNFETEILKRFSSWTIDEILYTCHLYYKLRISRASEFTYHSLKKIARKPQLMNHTQLIHLTFLMKMNRRLPINMYNIEYYTEQQADKLSVHEVGIFTMAFTQYATPIRSPPFIEKIIDKLIDGTEVVDELTLTSILNVIRVHRTTSEKFMKLLEEIEKILPRLSLNTLVATALAQKKTLMHSESLMSKIIERCEAEVTNLNIKQIEKLMLAIMTLSYDPKTTPFISVALREVLSPNKLEELERFRKPLVLIAHSALIMNHWSEELEKVCKTILEPEFIQKFCNGDYYYLNREYLEISLCLNIDHPEYTGPKLDEEIVIYLSKTFGCYTDAKSNRKSEKDTFDGKLLTSISETCEKALKSESAFYRATVLPHVQKAFGIICYDPKSKEYGSPEEQLALIPWHLPKYAPADGRKWFAVVTAHIHQICNNTRKPVGKLLMQTRQLEQIGYETILVPYYEWDDLSEDSEKEKYILDILHR